MVITAGAQSGNPSNAGADIETGENFLSYEIYSNALSCLFPYDTYVILEQRFLLINCHVIAPLVECKIIYFLLCGCAS